MTHLATRFDRRVASDAVVEKSINWEPAALIGLASSRDLSEETACTFGHPFVSSLRPEPFPDAVSMPYSEIGCHNDLQRRCWERPYSPETPELPALRRRGVEDFRLGGAKVRGIKLRNKNILRRARQVARSNAPYYLAGRLKWYAPGKTNIPAPAVGLENRSARYTAPLRSGSDGTNRASKLTRRRDRKSIRRPFPGVPESLWKISRGTDFLLLQPTFVMSDYERLAGEIRTRSIDTLLVVRTLIGSHDVFFRKFST